MQAAPAYDPVKDFVPILRVAELPLLLIAGPNAPFKMLKELVVYAKQNPRKLSYATSGLGSPSHLSVEMFRQAVGIEVVPVPYKNGNSSRCSAATDTWSTTASSRNCAMPAAP